MVLWYDQTPGLIETRMHYNCFNWTPWCLSGLCIVLCTFQVFSFLLTSWTLFLFSCGPFALRPSPFPFLTTPAPWLFSPRVFHRPWLPCMSHSSSLHFTVLVPAFILFIVCFVFNLWVAFSLSFLDTSACTVTQMEKGFSYRTGIENASMQCIFKNNWVPPSKQQHDVPTCPSFHSIPERLNFPRSDERNKYIVLLWQHLRRTLHQTSNTDVIWNTPNDSDVVLA